MVYPGTTENPGEPNSERLDSTVSRTFARLGQEYVVVGTTHIRAWQAWLLIGIAAGIAAGLVLVASRSGEVEEGRAQAVALAAAGGSIFGTVVDGNTEQPLNGADLNLFFFKGSTSTPAWDLDGSENTGLNGQFIFTVRLSGGSLRPGHYLLEIESGSGQRGMYEYKQVQFSFSGTDTDLGNVALPRTQVRIFTQPPANVPSQGGPFTWQYRVQNVSSQRVQVILRSYFHAYGITSTLASAEVRSQRLSLASEEERVFTDSVVVPAQYPDFWFFPLCATISVYPAALGPFYVTDFAQVCASKG